MSTYNRFEELEALDLDDFLTSLEEKQLEEIDITLYLLHEMREIRKSLKTINEKIDTITMTIQDLTTANGLLIQKADIIDAKADILSAGLDKVVSLLSNTNLSAADQKLVDDAVTATQADAANQDAEAAKLDAEIAKIPA